MVRFGDDGKHDMHVVMEYTRSRKYCVILGGLEAMWYGKKGMCESVFFIFPAQRWWLVVVSWIAREMG